MFGNILAIDEKTLIRRQLVCGKKRNQAEERVVNVAYDHREIPCSPSVCMYFDPFYFRVEHFTANYSTMSLKWGKSVTIEVRNIIKQEKGH